MAILPQVKEMTQGLSTKDVMTDRGISELSKLILLTIMMLCKQQRYCFASNAYFAEMYGKTTYTISRSISELRKSGYIRIESEGRTRKIWLTKNANIDENNNNDCQKPQSRFDENRNHNNSINKGTNKPPKFTPEGVMIE